MVPVRSPEEEQSTFVISPGLKIQLVAAEPMVQDPVVISFLLQVMFMIKCIVISILIPHLVW